MDLLDYDLTSSLLDIKKKQLGQKDRMSSPLANIPNGIFSANTFGLGGACVPKGIFAIGGDLQTNGADFSTGATHIGAGGSHEENPNDGVQMGVDNEGVPNLVEEGEVVFNDYVFSKRIGLDQAAKERFHFPKKKDITYADAAKRLEKEIAERPNDPISKASFKAQMEQLEEQQERQKAEMEAARAREAFEALSPEEQTALMQQRAEQEQMAQEAAQQQAMQEQAMTEQPSPEEAAMMQQQMMQADGSQAMIGQEPQVMAEGGHLFPWGGLKEMFNVTPPYAASRTAGFIPYTRDLTEEEVLKREQEQLFKDWTDYVNTNWDTEEVQNYLRDLDAAAGGNHLFDKEGKILPGAKDYFNHARTKNHKWGYYHLTPQQLEEAKKEIESAKADPKRVVGYSKIGQKEPMVVTEGEDEVGKKTVITTPIPEEGVDSKAPEEEGKDYTPKRKAEWLRYAGLLGPTAGLDLMAAGVGRPDTSGIDAAVNAGRGPAVLANWKPIGDYMAYKPNDPWFYTAPIIAQSNATQRSINNTTAPSRSAASLANAYNTMIALGKAQREQLDSNYGRYAQSKEFNRGTNQFNAQAYNQNQQFNADAQNRARQYSAQLALQGANAKMDADAGWYNGLYGNIAGLFKGIGDIGRENYQMNRIAEMAARGDFGSATDKTYGFESILKEKKKSKGGKIKKKGLTF